jgi:hypothetical protein
MLARQGGNHDYFLTNEAGIFFKFPRHSIVAQLNKKYFLSRFQKRSEINAFLENSRKLLY